MGDYKDISLGFFVHLFKDLDKIVKAPEVDSRLGLVKYRKLSSSRVDHSDLDSLELAARKRLVYLAVYVLLGAKTDLGEIFTRLRDRNFASCGKRDKILDRNALKSYGLLEGKADACIRALGYGHVRDIHTVKQYLTRACGVDSRDKLRESGFSASVRACYGDKALVYRETYVVEYLSFLACFGIGDDISQILYF